MGPAQGLKLQPDVFSCAVRLLNQSHVGTISKCLERCHSAGAGSGFIVEQGPCIPRGYGKDLIISQTLDKGAGTARPSIVQKLLRDLDEKLR